MREDCFGGPLRKREPIVLDAYGHAVNGETLHVGITMTDALTRSTRGLFAPDGLVTLTDDPPRADASLAWKYRHGTISDTFGMDWFADTGRAKP